MHVIDCICVKRPWVCLSVSVRFTPHHKRVSARSVHLSTELLLAARVNRNRGTLTLFESLTSVELKLDCLCCRFKGATHSTTCLLPQYTVYLLLYELQLYLLFRPEGIIMHKQKAIGLYNLTEIIKLFLQ